MSYARPIGQPISDAGEIRPGALLGRYEVLLGIAQGGMARVWAARQHGHRGFKKTVAIKTILPTLANDPEFEAMFLDEARVAAGVHHPNVCEIFDLGEEDRVLYLAMEWVNGDSLARILKTGPANEEGRPTAERINARLAARIIADAAAGLHAAHELCDDAGNRLNVVHRDVSPQNILLSIDGNVKVTDFGVAKALGMSHEATMAGQVKGKAAYMAPEQASGHRVDRRSDIFALGICLYEITTGQRPFSGTNQVATLKALLEGRFEPPSALVPGYPRELETIVMRAMAMDPMQRFPSADRMRVALEEWLARSGPVVTQTQVGALVRERVGAQVDERRAQIRQQMQSSTLDPRTSLAGFTPAPSGDGSLSSPSSVSHVASVSSNGLSGLSGVASGTPPPQVTSSTPPRSATSTALLGVGIGLGIFVLVGLGAAGWMVLGPKQDEAAAQAPATPKPAAPPSSAEIAAAEPKPPPTTDEIRLRAVIPGEGIEYQLDGKPFDPSKRIPRPEAGESLKLSAKAEGYQNEIFRIDENTPDVLDVILVEEGAEAEPDETPAAQPKPKAVAAPIKPKATTATKPKKTSPDEPPPAPWAPAPKQKPASADIPDNPF